MNRFLRKVFAGTAVCAALVLSMAACTDVDDRLGANFIPEHQRLRLQVKTLENSAETYIARNDSIPSNYTGHLYIGQMLDPVFGATHASGMTDFYPPVQFNEGKFFGYQPVVDSAFMQLIVTGVHGKSDVAQTFNVYALRDSLNRSRDSIYHFSVPLEEYVDMDKPLFSFDLNVDLSGQDAGIDVIVRLDPTAEGEEFLQRIVETDSVTFANPAPAFHQRFKGLYIAPAPDSPEDAAMYEINLNAISATGSSSLVLWTHSYDRANPTQVKDTLDVTFRFSDALPYFPNMNVNRVVYTYPSAIADNIFDPFTSTPDAVEPNSTVYVQSLGGVCLFLDFSLLAEQLEELKSTSTNIIIKQAHIFFPLEDPTTANLDAAPLRMGMYFTYGQSTLLPSVTKGPIPIPDYDYELEAYGRTIPYNGYIYRTPGYYMMDITHYVTNLLLNPETTPYGVWLGNEVNGRNNKYTQVALRGSEAEPIKIVLTYTIVGAQ